MDLQDFDGSGLYFDGATDPAIARLLVEAGEQYGEGCAEALLLRAQALAPDSLMVLVGLYRFYYYQHRYADALDIAFRAMEVAGRELELPASWQQIREPDLAAAASRGMGLLRFYLLALKGAGYLCLRLRRFEQGKAMLTRVAGLDPDNRLGARLLLEVLASHNAEILPFPGAVTPEVHP